MDTRNAGQESGRATPWAILGVLLVLVIGFSGVRADDRSAPILSTETMSVVGQWDPTGTNAHDGVYVVGNTAYLTDWVRDFDIVDVTNPAAPVHRANLALSGQGMDVIVEGNYAYLTMKSGGLRIVDVSIPTSPHEVGSAKASPTEDDLALHLFKSGNRVYVSDERFGVVIYNVSTPSNPTKLGAIPVAFGESVWVEGNLAYVTAGNGGFVIYDVTNAASPAYRGGLATAGYSYDVQVVYPYAYVSEGIAGLRVIDISNPSAPTQVGAIIPTASESYDVRVAGGFLYVAERQTPGHVEVFDLSNPALPVLAGSYTSTNRVNGVYPVAGKVYSAAQDRGLLVLDASFTQLPTSTPTITRTPTQTLTPTVTRTPTRTATPTATPDPSQTMTLVVQVTLQGRGNAPAAAWAEPLTVQLAGAGGGSAVYTHTASCDASGVLTWTGVVQGTYDVLVRDGTSLANRRQSQGLSVGTRVMAMGTLMAGDSNLDGRINILDFALLAGAYGAHSGEPGYNAGADVNGDGNINILDFALLAANYGLSGPRDLGDS